MTSSAQPNRRHVPPHPGTPGKMEIEPQHGHAYVQRFISELSWGEVKWYRYGVLRMVGRCHFRGLPRDQRIRSRRPGDLPKARPLRALAPGRLRHVGRASWLSLALEVPYLELTGTAQPSGAEDASPATAQRLIEVRICGGTASDGSASGRSSATPTLALGALVSQAPSVAKQPRHSPAPADRRRAVLGRARTSPRRRPEELRSSWLDVVVHAEEIAWIVLRLDPCESAVVVAVGGRHTRLLVGIQVVHVHPAVPMGGHGAVE